MVLLGLSALDSAESNSTPILSDRLPATQTPTASQGDSALARVVDQLPMAVAVYDIDEALVAWNPAYERLYASTGKTLAVGEPYEDILANIYGETANFQGQHLHERTLEERLRWHRAPNAPWRVQAADDTWFETEEYRQSDGGFIVVIREITQQVLGEDALEAARSHAEATNRAKSEFMATMSHELRTPLNAIIGFSETISDDMLGTLGDSPYREYAKHILNAGRSLLGIVNDILELSRLEAGEIELNEDRVELASLLNGVTLGLRERISRNNIEVTTDISDEASVYFVDPRAFRQVLHNLISNAVKFTDKGGKVEISSTRLRDRCIFTVRDSGVGMTAEEVALALQPFKQLANPMVRKTSGTGLGLPLTKALVDLHDGKFELSSSPGKGTEARVILPLTRLA